MKMSNDEELNTSLRINYEEINNDNTSKNENDNQDNSVNKQVSFDNNNELLVNEKDNEHNVPDFCFDDNLNSYKHR